MRAVRCKNLHLSGIDVLLPALVSIDGRRPDDAQQVQIAVSFAEGQVENAIAPLLAHWLAHAFHRRFVASPRDLAAVAFYDKLASSFDDQWTFAAALVFPRRSTMRDPGDSCSVSGAPAGHLRRNARGSVFSGFVNGTELARWTFRGCVRAFVDPAAGSAQVTFDRLPGGIGFASDPNSPVLASCILEGSHEVSAWYGFGTPIRRPDAAIAMLRDAVAVKSRRARAFYRPSSVRSAGR